MKTSIRVLFIFLLMFIALSSSYAGINDGLVAYYPFNGNADDSTGNGNHGLVQGATLTMDRFGNQNSAYFFNGSSYIRITTNINVGANVTLAAWIKTSSTSHDQTILEKGGWDGAGNGEYGLLINEWPYYTGKARFQVYESNRPDCSVDTVNPMNDGQWHLLVGSWDGKDLRIYVDGYSVNSRSGNGTLTQDNEDLIIGSRKGDRAFFNGTIDDVRIYNRALSGAEIQYLFTEGTQPPSCFTQEQLDQAVNDANAAKDAIIAQRDQTIAQLTAANAALSNQVTQLTAENDKLVSDIQQGVSGLTEIQNLLNSPQGQRKVTTLYSGQLGNQINTIIKLLLPPGQAKK